MPKVDVILVKYNQPDLEADTIRHVLETAGPVEYGLVAHQNAPGVSLSSVWNRLIANSSAKYVCLLNTDTIPARRWLTKLVEFLDDNPDVAAVVPSSNRVHLSQVDIGSYEDQVLSTRDSSAVQRSMPQRYRRLPTCSAMCVVFRRRAWRESGGFDEEFSFYGEDTEFFYRVRAMGLGDIVWLESVYVHHIGQQSFQRAVQQEGLDYVALRRRAMELWIKKKGQIDECYPDKALPV